MPLGYLNSRILQCHDIWHEVGGFDTTVLHEIAISGFQLGQFGHHYSSMFLAVTASKVALTQPVAVELIFDMVLAGWVHGRETPALLGVPWEQLWHEQVDEIRTRLGVSAFEFTAPGRPDRTTARRLTMHRLRVLLGVGGGRFIHRCTGV